MERSESIKLLACAMSKAQGQIENATKDTKNDFFKSTYADLASVLNSVRPVLSANGLSITQMPSYSAGIVSVESLLMHDSGEWIISTISAPTSKQDAQGIGSAITYCRRYAIAAIAGIAQEDDDANAATGKTVIAKHRPAALKDYPAEQMATNLPKWRDSIAAGKVDATRLIATIGSKYTLSAEQVENIQSLETIEGEVL